MFQSFVEVQTYLNERKNYGIKLGLERVEYLLKRIDHPENKVKAIHVAGTNGKGSTIHFLEKAFIISGYTVGVFNSPSFYGICGHITINEKPIGQECFIRLLNRLIPYIEELDKKKQYPTEFEIITVIALLYFAENVQIALIETGMGGKEDTTNCIHPLLSIITNVEMDHMQFLGSTYRQIAQHKAGIIKNNRPIVVGKVNNESEQVVIQKAKEEKAPLFRLGKEFQSTVQNNELLWTCKWSKHLFTIGNQAIYQVENLSIVFMALTLIEKMGYKIAWRDVITNSKMLSIPGRFEYICQQPKIILDSAHNIAGLKAFIHTVSERFPDEHKIVLFSAFKDKQIEEMVTILEDEFQEIIMTTFSHERAITAKQLNRYPYKKNNDWKDEIEEFFKDTSGHHIYFVTGSMHFIMEVRNYLLKRNKCDIM